MPNILEWIDSDSLARNPEINSRNLFAQKHSQGHSSLIIEKYIRLTLAEFREFIKDTLFALHMHPWGVGVELGAGVGGLSNSLLTLYPGIMKIYAVEIVPDVVRLLQTRITTEQGNDSRLIPVIGSFDDIRLPDNSVNFVVEFDSLHHSDDLNKTLREVARILKPGGMLIALDRMHSDAMPDAQREHMLNIEYGEPFKKEYGIPLQTKLTRRQNGEHEIRRSEWKAAIDQSGLQLKHCVTFHRKCRRGFMAGMLSLAPFPIRRYFRKGASLSRFPLAFFLFYGLPFFPFLWQKRYQPMKAKFAKPESFLSKTVFVAIK